MQKSTSVQCFTMWMCAACFYAFQFILRVSPSNIVGHLMDTLAINACTLGTVISFYYHGYSIMQVPTGLILDRLGVRRPLLAACVMCVVGSLMFSYATSTLAIACARALMGIGSAFGFLSCVKVASENFTSQKIALLIQLTMVVGTCGAACGGAPFAQFVSIIGWQNSYKALAGLGVVLILFILWAFRSHHAHNHQPVHASRESTESVLESLLSILRNRQTWVYGTYGFMMYVPLSGFIDLWAPSYFERVYNIDGTSSGAIVSSSYVGLALGAVFWSWLAGRLQSYKQTMAYSAIVTGVLFLWIIYLPCMNLDMTFSLNLTYVLMFMAGAALAGQFIAFASLTEANLPQRTATASGINNMFCMLSGVIMMPLIGAILDIISQSSGTVNQGLLSYAAQDFRVALCIVPLSIVFALVSIYFVKDNYPKSSMNLTEGTFNHARSANC